MMRKAAGYCLFVLSFVAWIAIAALPFFDLSLSAVAAISTGLIIAGEVLFFLSVLLLGREFVAKTKQAFSKLKKFSKKQG
jgi:hypothetical protein